MRWLQCIFDFYIDASIHVALAVVSLVLITGLELGFIPSYALLGFVFFGSVSGYNFVKYAKAAGLHHRSLTRSLKTIQIFSFLSFGGVFVCALQLPLKVLLVTALFGLLTLFYAVPFPAYRKGVSKKNLRNYPGVKLIIVGIVWAGVTFIVPQIAYCESDSYVTDFCFQLNMAGTWILFFQRMLLVMVFTLPFELRDLPYDAPHLRTLPQVAGVKKTVGIGITILTVVMMLEGLKAPGKLLSVQNGFNFAFFSVFLICVFSGILLVFSQKKQSKYFASFGVESIPIVWVIVYLTLLKLLG